MNIQTSLLKFELSNEILYYLHTYHNSTIYSMSSNPKFRLFTDFGYIHSNACDSNDQNHDSHDENWFCSKFLHNSYACSTCKHLRSRVDRYLVSPLRVRNLKFARNLPPLKTLRNSMKKIMLCLKVGIFQFKKPYYNLPYIQQISPQFIIFINISTCGEFQMCGEFYISYSIRALLTLFPPFTSEVHTNGLLHKTYFRNDLLLQWKVIFSSFGRPLKISASQSLL